jgi:iron(III) transport system substrate-binding protein
MPSRSLSRARSTPDAGRSSPPFPSLVARLSLSARLSLLALLLACAPDDGRTVVTVYSPHGKELLGGLETAFERENPGVDVQWVDMGAQEVLERLQAERDNPQADVWFGAPAETFERAARQRLLAPYRPTWAAASDAESHDPGDAWYGTYLTPEVIGYNTELVAAADAPRDWDDVLDDRWKGKVLIRDPVASGSMRAIWGAMLLRSIRETGSTEAGWAWLRRLDASTKEYTASPAIMYQKLGRGEGLVTLYNMPDIATLKDRFGYPIGAAIPASGTPLLVDAIALVRPLVPRDSADRARAAARAAAAVRYYEFVTSRAALLDAATRHRRIPARTDLPADSLPDWIRVARTEIRPMPLDRRMLADSLDGWMTYWDNHVRNRSRGK